MGVVGPEPENIQGLSDDFLLAHVLNLSIHFQYKVVYVCIFSLQVNMNPMRNIRPSSWQINLKKNMFDNEALVK